jgi:diguanylate cyclase (GGDEF)-like protein/PAS domain S-box-containing protein
MLIDSSLVFRQIYCSLVDFALVTLDLDGGITGWNKGAEIIFGYAESDVLGTSADRLYTAEDRAIGVPAQERRIAQLAGRSGDFRWHLRRDGSRFWSDGILTPILNDAGAPAGFMKILRDVTASKLANDKIEQLASFDILTGVANRISFDTRLAEMLSLAERGHQLLNLFAIDLDRFKEVNDQFGHGAGDALLKQAAQRLKHVIREGDVIARIGGDEFALLQLNPPSPACAADLAGKLIEALQTPFDLEGHDVQVSGSIGIAVYPDDATSAHDLRIKADLALYQAKKSGRNCFHYFTDELDDAVRQRNLDKMELRQLVAESNYRLEYQPIVRAGTGATIAMEALIRFPGPRLSTRTVDYTIDLAREIGVIAAIGTWVLRQACMQLKEWRSDGVCTIRIAINTCARELIEPAYVHTLEATLAELGLDPGSIEIELTEREAIELNSSNPAILAGLHNKGFIIVLDDFGTGYSSLSYLRGLPIDMIKLDRSFVLDTPSTPDANKVVTAVISLAHALHLEVTAEGVETQEQADFLQRSHCQSLQGYLFARSMHPDAATHWLKNAPKPHASARQ